MPLPSEQRAAATDGGTVFTIMTICSGNICRSPLLEQLLRQRLGALLPAGQLQVVSAGTIAQADDQMDAEAAAEGIRLGVTDTADHRSRRLLPKLLADVDLVLGLAKEHRSAAIELSARVNKRAFTAVEFAQIVQGLSAQGALPTGPWPSAAAALRDLVETAHRMRSVVAADAPTGIDIVDPYRRGPEVHATAAHAIDDVVRAIVTTVQELGRPNPATTSRGTLG